MAITGKGLVEFAKSKVGTPYVYGTKGEKLTSSILNSLAKSYPSMYTSDYKSKAKKFIGKNCTDCSGLISWYTGKLLSSSGLYASAKERHPISEIKSAPIGAILWRSGHVGVYIGKGECVEAKGILYGTLVSKINTCRFTHYLIMDYISYSDNDIVNYKPDNNNWIRKLQCEINRSNRNINLVEDGIVGPKTLAACPTLKRGSTGKIVNIVQTKLKEKGYYKFNPTSKFGKGTELAVKRYQRENSILDDGIIGKNTWNLLLGE